MTSQSVSVFVAWPRMTQSPETFSKNTDATLLQSLSLFFFSPLSPAPTPRSPCCVSRPHCLAAQTQPARRHEAVLPRASSILPQKRTRNTIVATAQCVDDGGRSCPLSHTSCSSTAMPRQPLRSTAAALAMRAATRRWPRGRRPWERPRESAAAGVEGGDKPSARSPKPATERSPSIVAHSPRIAVRATLRRAHDARACATVHPVQKHGAQAAQPGDTERERGGGGTSSPRRSNVQSRPSGPSLLRT